MDGTAIIRRSLVVCDRAWHELGSKVGRGGSAVLRRVADQHRRQGACHYCCDSCNYGMHTCHFCGDDLLHNGRLLSGAPNPCYGHAPWADVA